MNCKNCSNPLSEEANYCQECGQSVDSYDKPLRPVLADMMHESLDIDGRLFLTLKTLAFKPGHLSAAYRDGQRTKFTPPLRLYLVISIVFFLLLPMLDPANQVVENANPLRSDLYSKLMFALLPLFALFLNLLFKRTFYLSNLIFAIHIHCITYLVIAIVVPMEAHETTYPILIFLQLPFMVYLVGYLPIALKHYYAESWRKTALKCILLFLAYASVLGISFDYVLHYWF